MAGKSKKVSVSEETQFDVPARDLMVIERRDWRRILKMVKAIKDTRNRWENAAWAVAAAAATCLISAFVPKFNEAYLALAFSGAVMTVILFVASSKFGEGITNSKGALVMEMDDIQNAADSKVDGNGQQLTIIQAVYGTASHQIDVTDKLNSLVKDDVLEVVASNDIAGDPHEGVGKELNIEFSYDDTLQTRTFKEGEHLRLP